tara:strand:+ start:34247 stop:34720 length:474 start_codon:yes stop_codon:yes gene_type:complete
MGDKGEKVNVIKYRNLPSFEKYEEVTIVGHEEGISPKATMWRTGSRVTSEQRIQFKQPTARSAEVMGKVITIEEVQTVVRTMAKLQACKSINSVGFSLAGNLYYTKDGKTPVSGCDYTHIAELVSLVNVDPRKLALQNSLNELLAKAEEIKNQIGNL